ncbi:histidinol-phosphate aminotransferase [Candidatus Methanomarinus sp.]|nr:histidinol-phosphate aminotransferase [ANME-2 cluster archaeon]
MRHITDLIKSSIKDINEYVPGKSIEEIATGYGIKPEDIIKLGSNENSMGPSPMAVEAVRSCSETISIYPSPDAGELRSVLAEYVGFPEDRVVMGAGMDGVVDTLMRMFIQPGTKALISTPTFSYYEIAVRAQGGTPVFIRRSADFSIDTDAVISSIDYSTNMVFLCSPNNPSGNSIPESDLREILDRSDALVFLDEAYVEFANMQLTHLSNEYDNLIVGRTLSKAMGIAGLRVGYGIVPEWIFREYMKATTPFAINRIGIAAGLAALKDVEYRKKTIENVRIGRTFLSDHLSSYCHVYPSEANFIMLDVSPKKSSEVSKRMLKKGIIIRDCKSFRDAGEYLIRITIGTPDQNRRVVDTLIEILQS